ncbi:HisA/HisF-related TIM barrel protein [Streptomyces sp. NPDC007000]|uniref:HisA/HisF-related TIM barrel protein n=1 Tax=Streptomyces sp. NPDC007000 TaxID=3155357 RepID=UPI0033F0F0F9
MTTQLLPDQSAGAWRVHVDLRHHQVTARPDTPPGTLIAHLLHHQVPLAVLDLDRSIDQAPGTALLEQAARRHPGRLWLGGRMAPADPQVSHLLDAGAAGVILGTNGLITDGRMDDAALRALARLRTEGKMLVSLDVLDDHLVTHGFTTPTSVPARVALDAVLQATGGHCQVMYVDAGASLRRTRPDWSRIDTLADDCRPAHVWYAGGLMSWSDVRRLASAGLSAVVGRAYLAGSLGLPSGAP